MKLWTVRAGRHGEQEQICIDKNVITIKWDNLPDLKKFKTRVELSEEYQKIYPSETGQKAGMRVGQVWKFANEIAIGDIVALPSKFQPVIHIGKVIGDYQHDNKIDGIVHYRQVKWLKVIPRANFDQDILYSFGSLLTVSKVSRENAAERVLKLANSKLTEIGLSGKFSETTTATAIEETEEEYDIEGNAKDQISKLLVRKFKGHALAELVEQILKAQGYTTQLSPPGPDGGIDILASSGTLGFGEPRICVQVKSTTTQVDLPTLHQLQGVMNNVNAQYGLIVSWSGFKSTVLSEVKTKFFFIRLWTADNILENIFNNYDKFSDEFKAELPLKRFWLLVDEND